MTSPDGTALAEGNVAVEQDRDGHRAVVRGITLAFDDEGDATVLLPVGRRLTIQTMPLS